MATAHTTTSPIDPDPTNAHQENPLAHLSTAQLEELAQEFDAIRDRVAGELGERDRRYIEAMIEMQRRLAVMGRVGLLLPRFRPLAFGGATALAAAKILENMEIGHNVMHGQWDWMNDPRVHSSTWDWDTASTAEAWKHSHNYVHHTFTNIRGKDKDLGYEIMRIDPHQRWHPVYLLQPGYNLILAALFEWGVALHDLDFEAIRTGEKSIRQLKRELKGIAGKARDQFVKDYVAWPLVSALASAAVGAAVEATRSAPTPGRTHSAVPYAGMAGKRNSGRGSDVWFRRRRPSGRDRLARIARRALADGTQAYRRTATANAAANIVRNVWSYAIIFCGHFPDQTYTYSPSEVEDESRGGWYIRQLTGAANIEGSPLFHVASGNLGYQVEHHLFPDMPSTRYAEIAPQVKDICERYGLPYNSGPFLTQLGMVQRTILRLAFPGGRARPKPGPYRGI
ncbi:MAG TPA: acyl-CoA desaturase [Solirubrobacterales bacterium]|jgi:linoleoyl-CoA desaturase|nr:acyl-CoA desaturase [Solirubrobacterales bacterium]